MSETKLKAESGAEITAQQRVIAVHPNAYAEQQSEDIVAILVELGSTPYGTKSNITEAAWQDADSRAAPSYQDGWIAVKDGLPPYSDTELYLTIREGYTGHNANKNGRDIDTMQDQSSWHTIRQGKGFGITYWQKYPTPPVGKERER